MKKDSLTTLEAKLLNGEPKVSMWCAGCHNTTTQHWKAAQYYDISRDLVTYQCHCCRKDREYLVTLPKDFQRN